MRAEREVGDSLLNIPLDEGRSFLPLGTAHYLCYVTLPGFFARQRIFQEY